MTSAIPSWSGAVDADALVRLLALQSEHDWLDYKRQCDLSSPRDEVEFAKDIGAMMVRGGYIVVGADDHGRPAGEVAKLDLFDPAKLHDKLAKYLPQPFEIRAATHSHQGQDCALVYAAPHPDGLCIFERDGTYRDGTKQVVIFRRGDVFARHGTRSERWDQRDMVVIKQQLRAAANRAQDQEAEAINLLDGLPPHLAGSGLWLAVAVIPEYLVPSAAMISPTSAQQFLRDWHKAQAPIQNIAQGTATYRQPGSVVITSQAASAELPWFWRLALHDNGLATGAYVLEQKAASSGEDQRWTGLPQRLHDGQTIPARRDLIEIHLLTLLDLLTAHASEVGAGGWASVTVTLLAPATDAWGHIALVNELVDENEQRSGWRLAGPRAHQPRDNGMVPAVHRVRLADMRDPISRLQAAHRLAAELLAIFGIEQPAVLRDDGTIDPYGSATDQQQLVHQHARHLGLPIGQVSPGERRQRYEDALRAARDELQQH